MEKYVFRPYNPIFIKLFEKEKKRLQVYLGENVLVEHIGSTAVPGLGGKGFIDIAVAGGESLSSLSTKLQEVGYEYRPDASTDERWFFKNELPDPLQETRRYHIHLTSHGSKDWKEMLAFRDYLRTHKDAVEKYAAIKNKAASISNQEREIYVKTKDPVILEIIQEALKTNR